MAGPDADAAAPRAMPETHVIDPEDSDSDGDDDREGAGATVQEVDQRDEQGHGCLLPRWLPSAGGLWAGTLPPPRNIKSIKALEDISKKRELFRARSSAYYSELREVL
jgi:hypothetical protein